MPQVDMVDVFCRAVRLLELYVIGSGEGASDDDGDAIDELVALAGSIPAGATAFIEIGNEASDPNDSDADDEDPENYPV